MTRISRKGNLQSFSARVLRRRLTARPKKALWTFLLIATALAGKPAPAKSPDYSQGQESFPRFYRPYIPQQVPKPDLQNTPSLSQMVREGKIALSLQQLLTAVVENNLDFASARYEHSMLETDILRAKSGQAPRGTSNLRVPSGLFAGAIGAGISGGGGGGGGGGGSSVTGSARQVSIGPRGSFDPAVSLNFSVDSNVSPLNTVTVAGVPVVTSHTTNLQVSYTQAFTSGTSFSFSFTNQRQSSTQQSLLFNPALTSRFNLAVSQQLLTGFGFAVNRRFLKVAENNRKVALDLFREQAGQVVTEAQNLYWDLVAAKENVRAAEHALGVAQRLYEDHRKRAEIGTIAPLDVLAAEAEVAARQRDLIVAQTDREMKELNLKNIMSKQPETVMGSATIETTDALPEPQGSDIPKLDEAVVIAMRERPELAQAEGGIVNQEIVVQFTRNRLKPTFNIFGLFASAGREGRLAGAWDQVGRFDFPEYALGFSLTIPILNRGAQADNLRSRMELRQAETALQRTRNQIQVEVRNAIIGLMQAKAQVEAANKAVEKTQQTLDAEEKKLQAGVSTPYAVIQVQRDLVAAEFAEVQARVTYAQARVELDRATGATLEKNNISLEAALQGRVSNSP
ncbi:MAG: TolC family protein [Acidobacteria bacterium]|nr:TolC family protein [Acidobacteriota bacterium]